MRRAFTMLELTFVIVIIGILAAIAVPKFAATRDDATITKAKSTLASIRSAINQEVQRRQMQGNFTPIYSLSTTGVTAYNANLFDRFDNNASGPRVLEYPIRSCQNAQSVGCWLKSINGAPATNGNPATPEDYWYVFPQAVYNINGATASVVFRLQNNRFDCIRGNTSDDEMCDILEH